MKKKRQEKIIELITQYEIETQEELARYLEREGYSVTQATISRDIGELSLAKVPGVKTKQRYSITRDGSGGGSSGASRQYISIMKDGIVSMEQAGNLLVIKTAGGMAMGVAVAIDAMKFEGIAGSIAGDDTILCAVKTEKKVKEVMKHMQTLISAEQN